jgi:hypothetical protein
MNEINTEVLDHIVLFHDKSFVPITVKAYEAISNAVLNRKSHISLKGALYATSGIAKVMCLEDFYEEYPAKRPQVKFDNDWLLLEPTNAGMGVFEKAPKKGREQMIKGLQGFCDKNPNALKAADLLSHMKLKMP